MADSGVKRFLKFSCLGCLGVVFLLVATVAIFGWISGSNAEFTESGASYPAERITRSAPLVETDTTRSADLPEPLGTQANRVRLVLTGVQDVAVRPCAADESLAVEATYDRKRVEFSERLDEEQDGTWSYTVEMTATGSSLGRLVQRIFSRRGTTLDVCLPADVPIALQAEMKDAGFEAELGGLWLPTIDVELERAGGFVRFDAPLREPAESVTIRANMGGMVLLEVGNASPAVLDVNYRFGGLTLDMTGDWRQDSHIKLEGRAGGATVLVPRSVHVEGAPDFDPGIGAGSETAPTLYFAPGTNFDDVTLRRR